MYRGKLKIKIDEKFDEKIQCASTLESSHEIIPSDNRASNSTQPVIELDAIS